MDRGRDATGLAPRTGLLIGLVLFLFPTFSRCIKRLFFFTFLIWVYCFFLNTQLLYRLSFPYQCTWRVSNAVLPANNLIIKKQNNKLCRLRIRTTGKT